MPHLSLNSRLHPHGLDQKTYTAMILSAPSCTHRLTRGTKMPTWESRVPWSRFFIECPALLQPVGFDHPCSPTRSAYRGTGLHPHIRTRVSAVASVNLGNAHAKTVEEAKRPSMQ